MTERDERAARRRRWRLGLRRRLWLVGSGVALLWVVQLVDILGLAGDLERFGIVPRTVQGLRGIPVAPLLHEGFGHLATNSVPLFVLGALVALRGTARLVLVTALVTLASGLATWALARGDVHVGASALVFGYFGFLLTAAVVERSATSLGIAALALLFYGGLLWGVLPTQPHVSWEGHLFGLAAGILAGRFASPRSRSVPAAKARSEPPTAQGH